MIKKSNEFRLEARRIGGGVGELEMHHRLEPGDLFGKCRICAEITLLPGQTIGEHAHEIEAEIYYMLRGELISVADEEVPFRPGDIMITGGGGSHAMRNDSTAPATLLAIVFN